MTRETILRNSLEMATHNLQCYSKNWEMTEPKDGCETEYKEAAEEVGILQTWLKEFHRSRSDSTVKYVGHINAIYFGKTYDGKSIADIIEFEVNTGASFLNGDLRMFKLSQEVQDWFIGEDGSCCSGKYDIEKDRRNSILIKVTVDKINYVRRIEWAVNEEV